MDARESVEFQPLPGSDALKTVPYFRPNRPLPFRAMRQYYKEGAHREYLNNDVYDQYLHMHKVVVGNAGAAQLVAIAAQLETEELPTFLEAAGWAYAEAGLAADETSAVERIGLVKKAENAWARSLVNTVAISETLSTEYRYDDDEGHRIALNLAYAPLIKSIIIGNVRPETLRRTLVDTAEIAHDSKFSLDRAYEHNDTNAAAFHRGFLFESSALMALLYMEDPRYVPLPSTSRADSGYYHRDQTHDISIINQHWGGVKKVVPVEIKSKASQRDKRRYKALIIPGKLRLSVGGVDPRDTTEAFYAHTHGNATTEQEAAIEQLSTQLREMLRLYQRGMSAEGVAMNSLTRFYDSKKVAQQYPELAVKPKATH